VTQADSLQLQRTTFTESRVLSLFRSLTPEQQATIVAFLKGIQTLAKLPDNVIPLRRS
jgi:hypothetical protein